MPPSEFLEIDEKAAKDGKAVDPLPNPAYEEWMTKDQTVLSYLFGSLSKEIFAQVSSAKMVPKL